MVGQSVAEELTREALRAPRIVPAGPPLGMLAELTHRCPLQCPYCSNPIQLHKANEELTTEEWLRVFDEAASLGVLQVHLSGGEPTLRPDLEQFVARLAKHGVYSNLITAGVNLSRERVFGLRDSGLDHLQLSVQSVRDSMAEKIGHYKGALGKKRQLTEWVREAGLPLTINAPVHRHNIEETADGHPVRPRCRRRAAGGRQHAILRLGGAEQGGADAELRVRSSARPASSPRPAPG